MGNSEKGIPGDWKVMGGKGTEGGVVVGKKDPNLIN